MSGRLSGVVEVVELAAMVVAAVCRAVQQWLVGGELWRAGLRRGGGELRVVVELGVKAAWLRGLTRLVVAARAIMVRGEGVCVVVRGEELVVVGFSGGGLGGYGGRGGSPTRGWWSELDVKGSWAVGKKVAVELFFCGEEGKAVVVGAVMGGDCGRGGCVGEVETVVVAAADERVAGFSLSPSLFLSSLSFFLFSLYFSLVLFLPSLSLSISLPSLFSLYFSLYLPLFSLSLVLSLSVSSLLSFSFLLCVWGE